MMKAIHGIGGGFWRPPVQCIVWRLLLKAAGAVLVTLAVSSCSKSDEGGKGGKEKGGTSVEDLQAKAKDLLEKAKEAGLSKMAPDELADAQKRLEEADELISSGEESKAKRKISIASNSLRSLIEDAEKTKSEVEKLSGLKKEVEAQKKKADAAKAETSAADTYKSAADAYKKALAAIEKAASKKSLGEARSQLEQAKADFKLAAEEAEENESYRKRAEAEKEAFEKWKTKALEKKADEKLATDWVNAMQSARNAEDLFSKGDFRRATEDYELATRSVAAVLDSLNMLEQQAAPVAPPPLEGTPPAGQPDEAPPPEPGAEVAEPAPPPPPEPAEPSPGLAPTPAVSVNLFDGYDVSKYPQELDAEDSAFLEQNVAKLVGNPSVIQYDPGTGAVVLDYAVGKDVQKDLIKLNSRSIVEYESAFIQAKKGMSAQDRKEMSPFSFAGNTVGFVCLPVPFRYYVRVEYSMQILTMSKTGTFTVGLMYDREKGRGFAAQWMSLGMFSGGAPKVGGAPPQFAKVADVWFDKTRAIPMRYEYVMPDPKKAGDPLKSGLFTVTYDVDGKAMGTNALSSPRYPSGVVAFLWDKVKFEIRELTITGVLDKETAVAYLREKLKQPKENKAESDKKTKTKTKVKAKEPEEPASPLEADPEASAGKKPAGSGPSKKGGDFDI